MNKLSLSGRERREGEREVGRVREREGERERWRDAKHFKSKHSLEAVPLLLLYLLKRRDAKMH